MRVLIATMVFVASEPAWVQPAREEGLRVAFDAALVDVFERPAAYRWVWTVHPDDNPVLALFETLERMGVPSPVARIAAYSVAHPRDSDASDVPIVGRMGRTVGRATGIPCLAALERPQPDYPLGPLPPVAVCRAVERYARSRP